MFTEAHVDLALYTGFLLNSLTVNPERPLQNSAS